MSEHVPLRGLEVNHPNLANVKPVAPKCMFRSPLNREQLMDAILCVIISSYLMHVNYRNHYMHEATHEFMSILFNKLIRR